MASVSFNGIEDSDRRKVPRARFAAAQDDKKFSAEMHRSFAALRVTSCALALTDN